jgi:hypothetical protein
MLISASLILRLQVDCQDAALAAHLVGARLVIETGS